MTTFNDIITNAQLLRAIGDLGFTEPTEIQVQTIPPGLEGQDLIGQAKTGSGKTLAFGVPLLAKLTPERRSQALILAPTRELCQQIAVELGKLAKHSDVKIASVFGGVAMNPQIAALRDSQVVVATPGRLLDHLERGTFRTESVHFLVFDEADRMFDMGFLKDMERIVRRVPKERQTLLFSATMPDAIKRLASQYQRNPIHVKTHSHIEHSLLPQSFYRTDMGGKFSLLVHLLKKEDPNLAIVFCKTKHGAKALARNLARLGFEADAMQGNLSQSQRDRVMADFKAGKIRFLVATDVAARGLDVKHVTHVFNYNISTVPEDYIHRIGRTARAGAAGKAITLVEPAEERLWRDILRLPNISALEQRAEHVERIAFEKHGREQGGRRGQPQARTPRPQAAGRPPMSHGARGQEMHSQQRPSGNRPPARRSGGRPGGRGRRFQR